MLFGKPIPFQPCTVCDGIVFKQDSWMQCPTCGSLCSPETLKCHPLLSQPGAAKPSASSDWIAACASQMEFSKREAGSATSNA